MLVYTIVTSSFYDVHFALTLSLGGRIKMKKTIAFLMLLPLLIFAQISDIHNSTVSYEQIEKSYLMGLNTDNLGLKVSSAYFLGEIESQKAVIPLMKMLRSAKTEPERLIAALSLIKIGDKRGIYLVKRRAEHCNCERTKRLCKNLYYAFYNSKYEESAEYVNEGDEELIDMVAALTN
jgi:hypothetical protein